MQWHELDYLYHQQWCTVLYDDPKNPGSIGRLDGEIVCPTSKVLPLLQSRLGVVHSLPPRTAVIIHPPKPLNRTREEEVRIWIESKEL